MRQPRLIDPERTNRPPPPFSAALRERLATARHVVILTGAGVSAESGVPTFREALTGLWAQYDPEELATCDAFAAHPQRVWDWYARRRALVRRVAPNPAHYAIAELQNRVPQLTLITQNVDGLHQRAGQREILELHGNLLRVKCFANEHPASDWDEAGPMPPRCVQCGSYLRPDVVWFCEELPAKLWERAQVAAKSGDVFFSIGASLQVYPAADLPTMALRSGATVIQINPEPTLLDLDATFSLHGPAGVILPALLTAVWGTPR